MDFIRKYLKGDYGLPVSFWQITIPAIVILKILTGNFHLVPGTPKTIVVLLGLATVTVFLVVGVWRASDRYRGSVSWNYLSKLFCLFAIGFVVLPIILGFTSNTLKISNSVNSSLPTVAANNEWTPLPDSDGDVYIDLGSIRRDGNFATMRTLSQFTNASSISLLQFDCISKKFSPLTSTWHRERMGKGDVDFTLTGDTAGSWSQIPSGESYAETMWKIACGKK